MALDHRTHDASVAAGDLAGHVFADADLFVVLFAAVGVAEVDHDLRHQARLLNGLGSDVDALGVVIGSAAAAQDDVRVLVTAGVEDGGLAVFGERHEDVRPGGGVHRVDGYFDRAIGRVLEAHWARQAGGELTVALTLGGAGADGAPAD